MSLPLIGRAGGIVTIAPRYSNGAVAGPNGSATWSSLPASGEVDGSAADGSTASTRYDLSQRSFQFSFQHLLTGQDGSEIIESSGSVSFITSADHLYAFSGRYEVTGRLWKSVPPYLSAYAAYSGFPGAQGPLPLSTDSSMDGTPVGWNIPYQQDWGIYSSLGSVGLLRPGPTYSFSFGVGLQARGTGSATYANGCMNADGSIGFDDLLLLVRHYGESFPSTLSAPSPVPDPNVISLSVGVGLLYRRRTWT